MSTPASIPNLLGIDWWVLFLVGILEGVLRYIFKLPLWVPSISEIWFLYQAFWLYKVDARSRAIYFYLVYSCYSEICAVPGAAAIAVAHPVVSAIISICFAILALVGLFTFRSEMERYFTETHPQGLVLSGVMTFFFSSLYFQYWFHRIYVEQNEPDLRLTGTT